MNAKIMLLAGLLGLSITSHAREFKSADGSKTIEADFVRYDPRSGNVTLKLEAGRNLVTPASSFSKEDVAYFIEEQKGKEQQDAISVKTDEKSDREDNMRGNMLYKMKNSKLSFVIRNSSGFAFNELTVNYWVVVERDNKGKKSTEVIRGTKEVTSLGANGSASIEGPTVNLVQGAISKSASGCPRVAAAAAAVDNDRILGSKIEILDATGKKIFSDSSSNRVEAHLSAGD